MPIYVTFFNVGKHSETLIVDQFSQTDEIIVWDTKELYLAARETEHNPIDGGVYTYGLAAAVSTAPDALISNRIVSCRAPDSLLSLLADLNVTVEALRNADWPEWPKCI